jgi:hypothetical protein
MCIIAIQPQGQSISKETLKKGWDSNSHGAGMMYSEGGEFIVKKVMNDFEGFYRMYTDASAKDVAIVLHFRIATSGGINDYNLHPFQVSDDVWFCHNGILDIEVPLKSKENDTQIFNNTILKKLPTGFLYNEGIMNMIYYSIGSYNKFVFLDNEGDYHIVNEEAGIWDNGIWYSNKSYMIYKNTPSAYGKRYNDYLDFGYDWAVDYKEDNKVSKVDEWDKDTEELAPCEDCGNLCDVELMEYVNDYNAIVCPICFAALVEEV